MPKPITPGTVRDQILDLPVFSIVHIRNSEGLLREHVGETLLLRTGRNGWQMNMHADYISSLELADILDRREGLSATLLRLGKVWS